MSDSVNKALARLNAAAAGALASSESDSGYLGNGSPIGSGSNPFGYGPLLQNVAVGLVAISGGQSLALQLNAQTNIVTTSGSGYGVILFDLHPQFENIYDFQGDSSCAGTGTWFGNSYERYAITGIPPLNKPLITRPGKFYTNCISGTTTAQLLSALAYNAKTAYSPYARQFFETIQTFPNNIRLNDAQPATIIADLKAIVTAIRGFHTPFGVPDNTFITMAINWEQNDIFNNSPYPDEYANYQYMVNWIRANGTVSQANGGLGADAVVDFENTPFGGGTFGVTPPFAYPPNTWTLDGQHGLEKTALAQAQVWAAVINKGYK